MGQSVLEIDIRFTIVYNVIHAKLIVMYLERGFRFKDLVY